MKNRTYIKDLKDHIGKDVVISAFLQTKRDQNKIVFLLLRDISGLIQAVVLNDCEDFQVAKDLSQESVVRIEGFVKEEKQAPGGFELEVKKIEVLSKSNPELPIPVVEKKGGEETNANTRFDHRWLDLRKSEKANIFKAWTMLEKGFRDYYYENNFIQLYAPSFMNTASETGAEVFEVNYFDRKAYLAQSPQFYKQMAIASGLEKVFINGPVFRAEESFTTRHLTEFTSWDFEVAYIESHHDLMDIEEAMIISGFKEVNKVLPEVEIPQKPFPRMTIKEVKERLKKDGVESEKEHDLSPLEERSICKIIKEEKGSDFLFVTDYDKSVRPFYHMRDENDPNLTKSADLLYRGIEITTLAQREHRPDILKEQAKEKDMDIDSLKEYISFFEYGCPPHGGGGIGPNRILMKMFNLENVREATFLPRDVNRLNP